MGNSSHKTMFKWSISDHRHHHLPSSTTSAWNKFVAVEKRRRRRQNLVNCCRQTTAFLFSHVGLSAMIVAYTVMGGFLFRALEGPFEKEEKNRVADVKVRLINEILKTTDSMGCYADESRMQFVRDLRDYPDSKGSKVDDGRSYHSGDNSNNNNAFSNSANNSALNSNITKHFSNIRPYLPNAFSRKSTILNRTFRNIDSQSKRKQQFSTHLFNRSSFNSTLHQKFKSFALEILRAIKESGWNGQDDSEEGSMQWSHAGAILYAITVITTIGYGHIAPKTDWGRIVTIIYALIGIPLTFLYLSNIGNFLADCFRIFYKRVCCDVFCCKKCERQRKKERLQLRKQRVNAIQRGLVMKAAMNTLMVDYGRNKPYDRLKSVVGIHMPDVEERGDDFFCKRWSNRRALSSEKSDCVGPQHYPIESTYLSLPSQAFHSDSSLTSEEYERPKSRKRVHRTNFKGVTILDPKSSRKSTPRQSPAVRCSPKPRLSPDQTAKYSKHFHFNSSNKDGNCDILKDGRVKYNKGRNDDQETNLLRIRRDSIFQSDSLLVANKQSSNMSKSMKNSSKTGKLLNKSLSVRFFHKNGKSQTKNFGNDLNKRKSRFPARIFFKQTSKLKQNSNNSKDTFNERNFFNWQKRKRKESELDKAKENWQKLIAYSRQLTEQNRRLEEVTSNPYYNSLPLKAESRRHANNEILACQSTSNDPFAVPPSNRKMFNESSSRHVLKSIDFPSPHRSKSSEQPTLKAKRSDEMPLTSNTTRKKRSKRQTNKKTSPDKSADGMKVGVKHIDSKNSIESYVTARCQSSIGEEETAVARSTNVARSFKRSKTCIETKQANNKTAGKIEKMADVSSKTKNSSTMKRKTAHPRDKSENKHNPISRSVSNDDCRSSRYYLPAVCSSVNHNQIFLGNSYSTPCVPQDPDDGDDMVEDDDCSKVTVPIYICLILISGYLFAGSALFSFWEGWNTITGSYFCFITLSTIGFGDIVPGTGVNDWASQAKLVLCTLWLALGLSLLAMCFNLMQEEVKERCRKLGVKLGLLKDDCKPIYE